MTVDHGVPTSTQLERDARLVSTDHKVEPEEIALGVVIGRTAEFFDFFVYGIGSVLVFPHVFFPFVDPVTGTLYSFMVFSLAFIARPIGSMIFMTVDRLYGRGVKLTAAMLLLGFSTAVISFLPGYDQIGAASIFLLGVCRVSQGLALGGAWDGLASLLSLNAPRNRRGWYAMMPQLGAPFGFLLASGLFAYFVINLSSEDFLSWGWRFPFYVAFTINVVALFARLRLVVTDEFVRQLQTRELEPVSVADMFAAQGRFVLIGAFVPLASFALFHLVTIFPLSWVTLFSDRSSGSFLLVQCAGAVVAAAGDRPVRPDRRPDRPPSPACVLRLPDRPVQRRDAVPARRKLLRTDRFHPAWLRVARAVVRSGRRRRLVQLLQPVPLHRCGLDLRPFMAHRRRVRAAGGARPVQQVRLGLGQRLSALGRRLHSGGTPVQQAGDAGIVRQIHGAGDRSAQPRP